ncbi:MAG: thioredoxin-dependent thiol peroxidase [Acidimicrobiia bacterium]|nr:thioredoxin-dependent thiol peroxidase [Acidimicrobiia bacterium]NNF70002.1 thioredoxin-dependent thiol peroxidase [Acidimicrobiia bacterium]NNK91884.1 thioredoxin-dependent thiol peroxidase [Acidimicrobiia bacterium]
MKLETGADAPYFNATDDEGTTVTLDDYAGHPLVLYFYPKAFTPGCTTESCDFRDRHEAFYKAGYEILGVSPDQPDKLAEFRTEYDLPFHLLSDPDHVMADAYGAWGIKKNYGKEYEGLIRSTIVIDASGTVEHAWYNVKATGHAERVARELVE